MVVGFNHNFRYKGEVYHIQTEDSGLKSPNIVTLLYQGGTILASKKTSYADIAKVDNLDQVVEELMKDQHKEMLRSLKVGEFDAVIERFQYGRKVNPHVSKVEEASATPVTSKPLVVEHVVAKPDVAEPLPTSSAATPVVAPKPEPPAVVVKPPSSAVELSLDEVILSYLTGDDK